MSLPPLKDGRKFACRHGITFLPIIGERDV
jgi:hypothetical protein